MSICCINRMASSEQCFGAKKKMVVLEQIYVLASKLGVNSRIRLQQGSPRGWASS
jgi:hypothetical protein